MQIRFVVENEFSQGNILCETISKCNYVSRHIEKTDIFLTKAKNKHLKNKQKHIRANRSACPNVNINCHKGKG